jgi:multidrug resistance efflux pump
VVTPKRDALAAADQKLRVADSKLSSIRARVKDLNARVASLEADLVKASLTIFACTCVNYSQCSMRAYHVHLKRALQLRNTMTAARCGQYEIPRKRKYFTLETAMNSDCLSSKPGCP